MDLRNPADLRELYEANSKRLYNLAYRLVGDRQWAEDILQETFVRAYARADTFKQGGNQSGFGTGDVFWEIKDSNQHTILRTSRPQPSAFLAPGRYVVESEARDKRFRTAFELKAGEDRTLTVERQ